MPFQRGNKHGFHGRQTPSPGRPTRAQKLAAETGYRVAMRLIEAGAEKIVKKYLTFAVRDAATSRHAVDKLIPPETRISGLDGGPLAITVTIKTATKSGT